MGGYIQGRNSGRAVRALPAVPPVQNGGVPFVAALPQPPNPLLTSVGHVFRAEWVTGVPLTGKFGVSVREGVPRPPSWLPEPARSAVRAPGPTANTTPHFGLPLVPARANPPRLYPRATGVVCKGLRISRTPLWDEVRGRLSSRGERHSTVPQRSRRWVFRGLATTAL